MNATDTIVAEARSSPTHEAVGGRPSDLLVDAAVLVCWSLVAGWLCWVTNAAWWIANLVLLTLPLLYLLVRAPEARCVLRVSFVVKYVVFVTVVFDYLCVRYDAWDGPSAFPALPGGVLVEQVYWCAMMILLAIVVHARFGARRLALPTVRWSRTVLSTIFFAGFVIALVPSLHGILDDYVYFKIGVVLYGAIFGVALLVDRRLISQLALTSAAFLCFNLGFELLALHNGFWSFSGEYVGWVTIAGWRFPIEELVFMVILLAPAIGATYGVYLNWKGLDWRR